MPATVPAIESRGRRPVPRPAWDLLRNVGRRSYTLTKWRLLRRMDRQTDAPVVVFCMSKTASSAIVSALRDAVSQPVYKIHLLLPESVATAEARYRQTDRSARPRHIFHASHLMRHLPSPEHPWQVVTIVREPVIRAASDFFQSGRRMGRLIDASTITASFEQFAIREGIPRTVDWFDRELKPSLGIDVYEHPFDVALGYGTIESPSVRMLVLRQDRLDAAPRALARFLGVAADVEIAPENVGAAKEYADHYATVLRQAHFSAATLDLAYGSRYATHFFGPTELEDLRRRWGSPTAPEETPRP